MVEFKIKFVKQALKDAENLKSAGLDGKAKKLLEVISHNPFQNPPPYESDSNWCSSNCLFWISAMISDLLSMIFSP